jgi:hypothetical protein
MGRDESRQTAKIPFHGKPIELYRPKEAQATIIYVSAKRKGDGTQAALRFFQVLEALVVKSEDWDRIEELMISGDVEMKDFSELTEALFSYDWPELPTDGQ